MKWRKWNQEKMKTKENKGVKERWNINKKEENKKEMQGKKSKFLIYLNKLSCIGRPLIYGQEILNSWNSFFPRIFGFQPYKIIIQL